MMKIAILGDSHVGALKRAWSKLGIEYTGIRITFFAHRGSELRHLTRERNLLVPRDPGLASALSYTSGGHSHVDLEEFDLCLVYGLGCKAFFYSTSQHYSERVMSAAAYDVFQGTVSQHIIDLLSAAAVNHIFVGHSPLSAAADLGHGNETGPYYSGLEYMNKKVYEPRGASLVAQPLMTLANGDETRLEFALGSARLAVGDALDDRPHPIGDREHMNDRFGEVWLEGFFERLRGLYPNQAGLNRPSV